MDKALACHTGSRGSNPDMTKVESAPILSGTSAMCTFSLTMPVVKCFSVNTCHREGKKRGIMVKSLPHHFGLFSKTQTFSLGLLDRAYARSTSTLHLYSISAHFQANLGVNCANSPSFHLYHRHKIVRR